MSNEGDPAHQRTVLFTGGAPDPASTVPDEPGSLLGSTVGNYRVVSLLGQGGMGKVYRAEHPEIGRQVAIKVVHRVHPEVVARFRAEALSVNRIGHPNIIDISDFGTLPDGRPYFVMELLEGEDLGRRLARAGRLTPAAAAPILAQTLDALEAAHAAGIVHRDLKPDNIFLARRRQGTASRPAGAAAEEGAGEQVKLLDFGVAKLRAEPSAGMTADGALIGTPFYMSPEQAMGRSQLVGPGSDVYAMGVILYQLFTGTLPFDVDTVAALLVAHAHDPPVLPSVRVPEIDPRLERVILRCLEKPIEARFHSAADLSGALAAVLPEMAALRPAGTGPRETTPEIPSAKAVGSHAETPPVGAPAVRAASPGRGLRTLAAAGVALALASGGALLYLRQQRPAARAASEIAPPPLPGPVLEGRER